MGPKTKGNVVALSNSAQFNVRWVAMLYDMINMAIDTGVYDDELEQHAIDRIGEIIDATLLPENHRLVEAHRKYPPPQ